MFQISGARRRAAGSNGSETLGRGRTKCSRIPLRSGSKHVAESGSISVLLWPIRPILNHPETHMYIEVSDQRSHRPAALGRIYQK